MFPDDGKRNHRKLESINSEFEKILKMYFIAVLYSLISHIIPTASQKCLMKNIRHKYGEEIFRSIRQLEKASIKLQKSKCDLEFLRFCLLYDLTPNFVEIKLWKKDMKKDQKYLSFKRYLIQKEYHNRNKDSKKLEKEKETLITHIKSKTNSIDFSNLIKYISNRVEHQKNRIMKNHKTKLEKLNKGPIGQS